MSACWDINGRSAENPQTVVDDPTRTTREHGREHQSDGRHNCEHNQGLGRTLVAFMWLSRLRVPPAGGRGDVVCSTLNLPASFGIRGGSHMRRREFITLFSAATVVPSLAIARGAVELAGKVWQIGWLDPSPTPTASAPSSALAAFQGRLKELGYVEGRDYVIEKRFADTYWDRLSAFAQDLVRRKVDVIVTIGTATVRVVEKATT